MKAIGKKIAVPALCLILLLVLFLPCAAADGQSVSLKEHHLRLELPAEYTLLNEQNASKQSELIEDFGYTVSSFQSYLKQNNIILFAVDPQNGIQISLKSWQSDFSADTGDLALLSEETLASVAKELVKTDGASYKTVSVNSMKMIEIRLSGQDSGGDFCSVQYLTIRNGRFYSLNTAFPGKIDDSKVQTAWEQICTLHMEDTVSGSVWDVSSVFEMILIWALILLAGAAVIFIVISFIRDIIRRHNDPSGETEWIERRKKFPHKK